MKFALLTRLAPGAVRSPRSLERLERGAMDHVRAQSPKVEWLQSYASFGRFDYLDLLEAPDLETVAKVAVLIRSYGHAHVEVVPLLEWKRFKGLLEGIESPEPDLDL